MNILKCKFTEDFLPLTYKWVNDNEIKSLINTPDFSLEDQKKWFSSIIKDDSYKIWGICIDNKPIGVFGIKNISNSKGEYWGYIGEKSYWGKGIGKWMIDECILFGKSHKIKYLYLTVFLNNERAINLYLNKGFKKVKEEGSLLKMERKI